MYNITARRMISGLVLKYLKEAGLVIPKRYANPLPRSSKVNLTRPHKILTNPVYLGLIRHKEKTWPGRHPAIIDQDLWQRVQEKLQLTSGRRRGRKTDAEAAPLTGKLRDETGDRLTPTHCIKAGKRHPYYVSNRLIGNGPDPTGWRLPARKLETAVATAIAGHLEQAAREHKLRATPDLRQDPAGEDHARALASELRANTSDLLRHLIVHGVVTSTTITLALESSRLCKLLGISKSDLSPGCCQTNSNQSLLGQWNCPLFHTKFAPLGKSGTACQLEGVSAGERSLLIKMVVDGGVNGSEFL